MADEKEVSFRDTLNLPRTDFPIRANAKEEDPKMLKRWESEDLFYKSFIHNAGKETFILHDGPPYANGRIHIGHAYNKILKDIIGKSQRMSGKHVPITPGWDCHGLPIELKVTKEFPNLPVEVLKKECRLYAQKWIEAQKSEFKELGVLMNWKQPYLTMDYSYEAAILRAFGSLVEQGYIEKKKKTVPWCPSDQTVLAQAEIEYKERKDPSIYISFPLTHKTRESVCPKLVDKPISVAVWTTTPWTIPLNRAVLLKPNTDYVVLDLTDKYIVIAQALADKFLELMQQPKKVVVTIQSNKMQGLTLHHPFVPKLEVPIILDHHVSLEDGTAAVHCAPGCGPQDYDIAVREGIEIYAPISPAGTYTEEIEPKELVGMPVADGQIWVIKKLQDLGHLLFKTSIRHSYPHCWRCHNGLIFRATSQWFLNLSHNNLRDRALDAINNHITFYPARSINFLKATIEGRLEWCLSRQRFWGVPIPALKCTQCEYVFTNVALVETVARGVEKEGIEYWDRVPVVELKQKCPECASTTFEKEKDILDVWFDSGISHYAVLNKNKELNYPANIYTEGVDQHRGWFQSSLLTSLILEKTACTKSFLTHGFVVDQHGHKMSKSLGNVVAPEELIAKMGVDGVRLWATTIDYSGDAVVSDKLIENVIHVFRKIRNTARFLISNLYDFDFTKDAVPFEKLYFLDQCILVQLYKLNEDVQKAYTNYDFTAVFHALNDFATVQLSQVYLDVTKDRLYTEKPNGLARRSTQTTMYIIVDTLTKLMAPILSYTAESVSDHYQKSKTTSIHLQSFNSLKDIEIWLKDLELETHIVDPIMKVDFAYSPNIEKNLGTPTEKMFGLYNQIWHLLSDMRDALLKSIEKLRAQGIIKHPYEAQVTMHVQLPKEKQLVFDVIKEQVVDTEQELADLFEELLVVSKVTFVESDKGLEQTEMHGLSASVQRAEGTKCPRCWQWHVTTHEHNLCDRCHKVLYS